MCPSIPTRIILFGNCPSRHADDALGWQHWRLLLVLICVSLITKLSCGSSFSPQPQSLAGALLAGAGEAVCEVAAVGRCHWALLGSLGPLSEHRGFIFGVPWGFGRVCARLWHQRLWRAHQGQRVWQLLSCARTTLLGTCRLPGAHPSSGNHGDRAAQLLALSWGPSPLFLMPCKLSGMAWSRLGGSPQPPPLPVHPLVPVGSRIHCSFSRMSNHFDAPKAMANGLHRPEQL